MSKKGSVAAGLKSTSQCLTILDDLQYFPLDSISDEILFKSIKASLEAIGKNYAKAVIDHICSLNKFSEREILTNCDIFEDTMYRLFGRGAQSIINKVKVVALRQAVMEQRSSLTIPEILDPSLTINDVLRQIRSIEALDFVHKMSSYNHIAYLYSNKTSLSKILLEYFSPLNVTKALLSENPKDYVLFNLSRSISYKELLGSRTTNRKAEEIATKMHQWIEDVRTTNESDTSTRIAEDDATWWIRNGYVRGLASLEQSLCKRLPEKTSILCAFDISKLNSKQLGAMKSIIGSHDYVIIEEPSPTVYKFGKPEFRYE